jgi:hypothetical protein
MGSKLHLVVREETQQEEKKLQAQRMEMAQYLLLTSQTLELVQDFEDQMVI